MAITVVSQPGEYTGAFADSKWVVTTSIGTVKSIRCDIFTGGTTLATQYSPTFGASNTAYFDLKHIYGALVSGHNNIFDDLPVSGFQEQDNDEHHRTLGIQFSEVGTLNPPQSAGTIKFAKSVSTRFGDDWRDSTDSRATLIYIRHEGTNTARRKAYPGQWIPISAYAIENQPPLVTKVTGGVGEVIGGLDVGAFWRNAMWKETSQSNVQKIGIELAQSALKLEYTKIQECYERPKILYFLNRFGGWEWYCFIDYEKTVKSPKTHHTVFSGLGGDKDIYTAMFNMVEEYKLLGVPATREYVEYLAEIIYSPVVYDETGKRVRVMDESIDFDFSELVQPEIRIQYIEQEIIRF